MFVFFNRKMSISVGKFMENADSSCLNSDLTSFSMPTIEELCSKPKESSAAVQATAVCSSSSLVTIDETEFHEVLQYVGHVEQCNNLPRAIQNCFDKAEEDELAACSSSSLATIDEATLLKEVASAIEDGTLLDLVSAMHESINSSGIFCSLSFFYY